MSKASAGAMELQDVYEVGSTTRFLKVTPIAFQIEFAREVEKMGGKF